MSTEIDVTPSTANVHGGTVRPSRAAYGSTHPPMHASTWQRTPRAAAAAAIPVTGSTTPCAYDGAEATAGSLVSAHYVGVTHDGGEQFDASWDRGDPLEFRVGVGMVIQGWDEGIVGMRVGGRRRLTIPAHKAYGERGAGGVIKPGATLVFVVDLVGVR